MPARLRKAGGLPLPAALRARGRHGFSPAPVRPAGLRHACRGALTQLSRHGTSPDICSLLVRAPRGAECRSVASFLAMDSMP